MAEADLKKQIADLTKQLNDKKAEVENFKKTTVAERDQQIKNLNTQLTGKKTEIENLNKTVTQKEQQITAKTTEAAQKDEELKASTAKIQILTAEMEEKMKATITEVEDLKNKLVEKNKEISAKNDETVAFQNEIKDLKEVIEARNTKVEELTNKITENETQISDLKAEVQRVKVGSQHFNRLEGILQLLDEPLQKAILDKKLGVQNIEDVISKKINSFFIVNWNSQMDELKDLCDESIQSCEQKVNGLEDIRKNLLTTLNCDEGTFSEEEIARSLQPTISKKQAQEGLQESWNQFLNNVQNLILQ